MASLRDRTVDSVNYKRTIVTDVGHVDMRAKNSMKDEDDGYGDEDKIKLGQFLDLWRDGCDYNDNPRSSQKY